MRARSSRGLRARWPDAAGTISPSPRPTSSFGALLAVASIAPLNALRVGDLRARAVGVDVDRAQWVILAASSLLAASSVVLAGLVGFIGLIVPHVARRIVGSDARALLPACVVDRRRALHAGRRSLPRRSSRLPNFPSACCSPSSASRHSSISIFAPGSAAEALRDDRAAGRCALTSADHPLLTRHRRAHSGRRVRRGARAKRRRKDDAASRDRRPSRAQRRSDLHRRTRDSRLGSARARAPRRLRHRRRGVARRAARR